MNKVKVSVFSVLPVIVIFLFSSPEYIFYTVSCALIHEIGHLFAIALSNCKIENINFSFLGIEINIDKRYSSYIDDIFISLSGPVFSVYFSSVIFYFSKGHFTKEALYLFFFSFMYGAFNLLPIRGLDGGEISLAVASYFFGPYTGEKTARVISFVFVIALLFLAIYLYFFIKINLSVILVAVYLFTASFKNK